MSGTLLQADLTRAGEALTGLVELPLFGLSETERLACQQAAVTVMRQAEALLVALLDPAGCQGKGRVARDVLVGQLRLSARHAGEILETAKALRDPEFAPTAEALASGSISAEHAKRLTQAVNNLPTDEVTTEVRGLAQQTMLTDATQVNPDQLVTTGKKVLQIVDPDAADRVLEKELRQTGTRRCAGAGVVVQRHPRRHRALGWAAGCCVRPRGPHRPGALGQADQG